MFSSENIALLSQLFLEEAKNSPTILGAKLGDIVKKQFPDENIRSNYGSVRNFVEKNFSEILKITGRQGIDNVYTFDLANTANTSQIVSIEQKSSISPDKPTIKSRSDKTSTSQQIPLSDDILRAAIKDSIDSMTAEQIRQLAIPAGILLDAINKTNRR
ncbi:hypothetical protein [Duganella sp. HH101]|uniref:hypothetical protein n=1 Tax=Duganella sp. HH101 TaxID=1781066 RepID=UPI00114CCA1C|nr:hypothetical protein [Duganella sp. HH101]